MSKKRQVDEDPNNADNGHGPYEPSLPVWSFNRAVPAAVTPTASVRNAGYLPPLPSLSSVQYPVVVESDARCSKRKQVRFSKADTNGDDDEDNDPEAMDRAWGSLTHEEGSSAPLPVLPSATMTSNKTPAASYYQPNRKHVPQPVMLSLMSPDVVDALTTYDKPERSAASPETRHSNFVNRVHRAGDKVQEAAARGRQTEDVDDSLMRDAVGVYLNDYRRHADLKTSERVLPPSRVPISTAGRVRGGGETPTTTNRGAVSQPARTILSVADTGDDDEDDEEHIFNRDEDEDEDDIPLDVHTRLAVDLGDDDNDNDDAHSRMLVAPMRRIPNTADTQMIQTFSEYTGPSPASGQFTDNMRHVKGRERGVYMELRDLDEEIYPVVTERLARNQFNNAVQRIAVHRGYVVPDPPVVTKAEIQDGLHAPNTLLGERPCVRGVKCASWKMCLHRIKHMPETHKGAKPFVCKEFYFGDLGKEILDARRENRPLAEVQAPELIMCVMCHFKLVTKWYKRFLAGLVLEPPHILHSFQVSMGVPGGYPIDKCLMGDKSFMGMTAPFIRHVPDNYVWESSSGVTERDPVTGRMVVREGPVIQCWRERDCMDFQ